jgi:K+-transporting ATPase A subunit
VAEARTAALPRMGLSGGNMEGKEVRFGIVASSCSPFIPRPAAP